MDFVIQLQAAKPEEPFSTIQDGCELTSNARLPERCPLGIIPQLSRDKPPPRQTRHTAKQTRPTAKSTAGEIPKQLCDINLLSCENYLGLIRCQFVHSNAKHFVVADFALIQTDNGTQLAGINFLFVPGDAGAIVRQLHHPRLSHGPFTLQTSSRLSAPTFTAGFTNPVATRALQLATNVGHHAAANRTPRLLGRRRFRIGFVGGLVGHGCDFNLPECVCEGTRGSDEPTALAAGVCTRFCC